MRESTSSTAWTVGFAYRVRARTMGTRSEAYPTPRALLPIAMGAGGDRRLHANLRYGGELLDLHLRAGFFQLLLELLGVFFGHAFLHGARSAFHEVLRFLQAQAGDGADFLDDVDLLVTRAGQHHGELRLGFRRSRTG